MDDKYGYEQMKQHMDEQNREIERQEAMNRANAIFDGMENTKYVAVNRQPVVEKNIERSEKTHKIKQIAAAIMVTVTLASGTIVFGEAMHERNEDMMNTYDKYLSVMEMTGQEVSEETYKEFIENNMYQDYQEEDDTVVRGGRN